jgi:hypothetical protein
METTLDLDRHSTAREPVWQRGKPEPPTIRSPSHELVARRAYEIWQRHGCPNDTAFRDWLAAEAELRSAR